MIDLTVQGQFPQDLADRIARTADAKAREYERQLVEEMVRVAKGKLGRGHGADQIAREMQLE